MTLFPGDVTSGRVVPGETMTIEIPRVGRMSVKAEVSEHARSGPWVPVRKFGG